jgi:hypothetical protein
MVWGIAQGIGWIFFAAGAGLAYKRGWTAPELKDSAGEPPAKPAKAAAVEAAS